MLRVVASIYTGAVRAYDMVTVLQRDGHPTALGEAFAAYGRIYKSLHILQFIDVDETYRRDIKHIRNLQQGRHALARKICHGKKGELYHRYERGLENQLGVLGLVLNCVVLWTTVYLDAAVRQLKAQGYPVREEDLLHLSPFVNRHLGVHGAYNFGASGLNFDFSSLRAYDLSSGRQLWSRNIRTGHVLQPGRYDLPIFGPAIVTTRGVVVFSRNEQDLFGLDLRTGQQRWTRKITCGQGTTPTTVSATATTAVVLSHCSGKSALSLVNPQNGDTHTIDVSAATDISTTPTALGVISGGSLSVFAASGKLLGRVQGGLPGRGNTGFVQVNGDQAVIFSGDELRAISLSHGNELWRRTIEGRVSQYVPPRVAGEISGWGAVGDLVVVNQAMDPQRPGPGVSSIAYPSGKITPLIPWPVSGMFVGAVPGMVFVVSHAGGQYRFTALRLDRKGLPDPSLGGAKPTDWPDPCQLLTSGQLATLGPGYTAVPAAPSPVAGRLHLPHTDQCNFGDGKRPFSLRVAWVAANPAAAETLTQSLLPPPDFVRPIGTNGYQFSGTTGPAADQAIVVHGRWVIAVHAPQQVALTTQIATLLQTTTRPQHPTSRATDTP